LMNPALLDLAFYPGAPDRVSQQSGLQVTRAGYVKLSRMQTSGKERLGFENGAPNFVLLNPDLLVDASDRIALSGDVGIDTIIVSGMPPHTKGPNGVVTWLIERPDGRIQTVEASGFAFIAQRN